MRAQIFTLPGCFVTGALQACVSLHACISRTPHHGHFPPNFMCNLRPEEEVTMQPDTKVLHEARVTIVSFSDPAACGSPLVRLGSERAFP